MIKSKSVSLLVSGLLLICGCSLAPEKPYTKKDLFNTGIYRYYTIKDSPDSVLQAINRDGEVVLEVKEKERQLLLKILATNKGLQTSILDKNK